MPPIEKADEMPFLGEQASSPYEPNETTIPDPRPGQDHAVIIAWGVNSPRGIGCQEVVDHVQQLTVRAECVLRGVLEHDSHIPPDIQQQIREWEQQKMGYGWVRWLLFATITRSVSRIENYPQKAATALWELREACRQPAIEAPPIASTQSPDAPAGTIEQPGGPPFAEDEKQVLSIRLVGKVWHLRYGAERGDYPKKGNKSIEWLAKLLAVPNRLLTVGDLRGDPEGRLAADARLRGESETDLEGAKAIKNRLDEIESITCETGGSEALENEKAKLLRN